MDTGTLPEDGNESKPSHENLSCGDYAVTTNKNNCSGVTQDIEKIIYNNKPIKLSGFTNILADDNNFYVKFEKKTATSINSLPTNSFFTDALQELSKQADSSERSSSVDNTNKPRINCIRQKLKTIHIPWNYIGQPPSYLDYNIKVDVCINNPFKCRPQVGTFPNRARSNVQMLPKIQVQPTKIQPSKKELDTPVTQPELSGLLVQPKFTDPVVLPKPLKEKPFSLNNEWCKEETAMYKEFANDWSSFCLSYAEAVSRKSDRHYPFPKRQQMIAALEFSETELFAMFKRIIGKKKNFVRVFGDLAYSESNCLLAELKEKYGEFWNIRASLSKCYKYQQILNASKHYYNYFLWKFNMWAAANKKNSNKNHLKLKKKKKRAKKETAKK